MQKLATLIYKTIIIAVMAVNNDRCKKNGPNDPIS